MAPALANNFGFGGHAEASDSSWESLPHGVFGARPAGPCTKVSVRFNLTRERTGRGERRRRQNPPVSAAELNDALDRYTWRGPVPAPALPIPTPGTKAAAIRQTPGIKRAKMLEDSELNQVLQFIDCYSRSPESDRVKVLLSFKAGLRAGEIAQLPIRSCLGPSGTIAQDVFVGSGISKSRDDRDVPINPQLGLALKALIKKYPQATHVAFSLGKDGRLRRQNAAAVTNWFCRLYKIVGFQGCSSHSGRRTFATKMSRQLASHHLSLEDLRKLLGHSELSSTQCYLEPSDDITALINAI